MKNYVLEIILIFSFIFFIALVVMLTMTPPKCNGAEGWGEKNWPTNEIHVDSCGKEGVNTIAEAIEIAAAGGVNIIVIHPGSYTIADLNNSKTLGLVGSTGFWGDVILIGTDTLITQTTNPLKLESLTITTTGTGSAIVPASNAKLTFYNCDLDLNWQVFTDSTYIYDSVIGDSVGFTGYYYLEGCTGGPNLTRIYGDATGRIVDCDFYSTSGTLLQLYGDATCDVIKSTFESQGAYIAFYAYDRAVFKTQGSIYHNNGTSVAACTVIDSVRFTSLYNGYWNEVNHEQNYGLFLATARTVKVGGDQGTSMRVTNSGEGVAPGIITIVSEEHFGKMTWFQLVYSDSIATYVDATYLGDQLFFQEKVFQQVDVGGMTQCLFADGATAIHLQDSTGNPTGLITMKGEIWGEQQDENAEVITMIGSLTQWNDMPSGKTEFRGNHRMKYDFTDVDSIRWGFRLTSPGWTDAKLWLVYSENQSTWYTLSADTLSLASAGTIIGNWGAIPAGAKADYYVGILGQGGNGAADPAFKVLNIQLKTGLDP